MNIKEFKLETLKDLRDFLNEQKEEFLLRPPYVLIGDNDVSDRINAIAVFEEDHINPSGDCWEPVSVYRESEEIEDRQVAEDELVCGRKGDMFFIGGFVEFAGGLDWKPKVK